ncbi:MAG TPA: FimV/HubP family polar landmark protein [Burkholderiales bacterium]|nr:FimV/HubP family polar landmark protein [Burkholderiales bacterium]
MRQHKLKKIAVATALALSGAALLAPGAHAAGLGQINVLSGLGQPLRAEIDLTSVTRQEASTLAGKMAGPDAYRQAGVEMSPAMLGVRVAVNRRANGNYYLSLSTVQPVNDPFVDALIELNWASGRLVREYTFLLDPAEMKPVSPPVVAAAPAPAPVAAPVAPPAAEPPAATAPAPAAAPTESTPAPAASTPAPTMPEAVKPAEAPKPAAAAGSYTVKNGDTAAKIAGKNKAEGVSLDQMLVALYRNNQDAFVNGNINRLKSGVILNLPDKDTAAAVAPDDAHRLLVAQSADWKAYQDKVAGTAQTAPAPVVAAPKKESKGRITAKVQDQAQKSEPRDQLKLSKADSAPAKGSKKGAAASRVSEEDLVAKERALKDANSRVAELEKNVRDLQKLVEVKNQSLSDLQKQAAQAKADAAKKAAEPVKAAPPPPPPVVAKAEPPKIEPPKAVEPPKAEPPKAVEAPKAPEPPKAAEAVKAPDAPKAPDAMKAPDAAKAADASASAGAATTAVAAADATKPAAAEAPKAAEPPKVEAPKAPPKKAAPPPPPPPEPSLMDEFLTNPLYLGGAGLVLVLLGGYAAFAVRRKRKVDSFESSIITGGDLKANSVFGNTGGQSVDTGNSSFQSDFSQVGPGAIDADEVDPVAEADVYMAYGRDAQAEEILKEALVKDPNRQTVRMKLLEIYSQRRDPANFAAAATDLRNATGGQGEQWNRAAALGHQIDPTNPMYGGSGAAAPADNPTATQPLAAAALAAAAGGVGSISDYNADKTLTLNSFHPAGGAVEDPLTKTVALEALQNKGEAPDIDLDFDLGGDTTKEKASAPDFVLDSTTTAEQAPASSGNDVDFDLGGFGGAAAAPESSGPNTEPDTDFSPSGTLIMEAPSLGGGEKTVEMSPMGIPEAPTEEGGNNIDFDFDIGAPAAEAPAAPAAAAAPAAGGGMDFDLASISLELPGGGDAPAAGGGAADDAATQLDLAKAYHEMGDKDGAKELLGEVLKEGSAAQQAEAQQLLASI